MLYRMNPLPTFFEKNIPSPLNVQLVCKFETLSGVDFSEICVELKICVELNFFVELWLFDKKER